MNWNWILLSFHAVLSFSVLSWRFHMTHTYDPTVKIFQLNLLNKVFTKQNQMYSEVGFTFLMWLRNFFSGVKICVIFFMLILWHYIFQIYHQMFVPKSSSKPANCYICARAQNENKKRMPTFETSRAHRMCFECAIWRNFHQISACNKLFKRFGKCDVDCAFEERVPLIRFKF